jgi:hypothetical protein
LSEAPHPQPRVDTGWAGKAITAGSIDAEATARERPIQAPATPEHEEVSLNTIRGPRRRREDDHLVHYETQTGMLKCYRIDWVAFGHKEGFLCHHISWHDAS